MLWLLLVLENVCMVGVCLGQPVHCSTPRLTPEGADGDTDLRSPEVLCRHSCNMSILLLLRGVPA